MYVMGIDSGSTSTNAVIMDQDRKIKAFSVVRTGAKSGVSAERALNDVLEKAGLTREDISWIVSTDYGRVSIEFADENVTEISCHGKGAHYFNPEIRTILDIGGQDSKAIRLNENGEVKDFVMNDKCAAGTGRFIEVMARVLEVSINEMQDYDAKATEPAPISSTCTVFAESEVISQLSQGTAKENIIAGVHASVAVKACGLAHRGGVTPDVVMSGGVAQNAGVVRAISRELKQDVIVAPHPQVAGALGAALFAYEDALKAMKK